jgi:hypothetical protein
MKYSPAPVVMLSNGLLVANFSSPHPFNFEDNTILSACDRSRAEAGELNKISELHPWPWRNGVPDHMKGVLPKIYQSSVSFKMTHVVIDMLSELEEDRYVDIVLVPLPVLFCIRDEGYLDRFTKAGTIFVVDRTTKAISINKFCR